MTKPRILIPIHDFNPGGTEAIALRLASEWLARGWQVSVLAGDSAGPMRARVPAGADVEVLNPPVPRSALSRLKLGRAMAARAQAIAPDLVFIIGNFHYLLAHALKRSLPGVPIIAKISNPLLPEGLARTIAGGIGQPLLRRYLAPIDRVVAMTASQARDFHGLMPQRPITVIADPNVPDDLQLPAMRDRRASAGPIELALVGRLEPQKDVALALDVLAELRQSRDARLTVLGEGYLRGEIEAKARQLGLEDRLALPGFSDRVGEVLSASDLLLITSRYEGVPGAAIEALAAALPVVSTDCSEGLAALLQDPRLGRIVTGRDPQAIANALIAQLAEPPAPPELLEQTLAPSRFSVAADAYLQVFEAALGNRSA
ncbi:MAG: glycosyltransferase [Novosphingobium sp.]|uniref:glycosyltransferase n=1 Tax=Novosphingobium sp. TaxID=1874826 RepID=UPI003C7AF534